MVHLDGDNAYLCARSEFATRMRGIRRYCTNNYRSIYCWSGRKLPPDGAVVMPLQLAPWYLLRLSSRTPGTVLLCKGTWSPVHRLISIDATPLASSGPSGT